jgi:hypothetical protein
MARKADLSVDMMFLVVVNKKVEGLEVEIY